MKVNLILLLAHERTLDTDVLMGLIKEILPKRKDLNVLVMSATINTDQFQLYFQNSPLIKVPGRLFPVEIFYLKRPERSYMDAVIRTIVQVIFELYL